MDAVFRSLASPTRRAILTLLRDEGPLDAGGIAARFPEVSRPAVSRDLRVLREADLVAAEPRGRCRIYRLNAAPLRRVVDDWFGHFDRFWAEKLSALERYAKRGEA